MSKIYVAAIVILVVLVFWAGRVTAAVGSLTPPGPPGATQSYTLEDLYQRLVSGAAGAQSTFTEPSAGPGTGTMHTLNDIMAAAPEKDNFSGATPDDVLAGKTFWGLTDGSWGTQPGAMVDNGAMTLTPSTSIVEIPAGYHDGQGYVDGDADLTAGNIKEGVTLFGVTGSFSAPPPAPEVPSIVPKTGQTQCWNSDGDIIACSGTGQDGEYQIGTSPAWMPSYPYYWHFDSPAITLLSASTPPQSRIGVRFTDNGDGTVTDNLTGLIWLKNANCFGGNNWQSALDAANNLSDGQCGLTDDSSAGDWRLPNFNELGSLIDSNQSTLALPAGHPFSGVQGGASDFYWSSTTEAPQQDYAWVVTLNSGHVINRNKTTPGYGSYYVWLVRGGGQ